MNAEEMGELLALAALYDNRTVGDADILAWLNAIGDLPYRDADTAVAAHYGESTERLLPAHVRERVQAIRAQRIRDAEIPPPPAELLDNPRAYQAALHAATVAIADGRDPAAAVQAVVHHARRELEAS